MVVSYDPLYFCVICCDFSIFISNFVDLIILPLFLDSLANGLSILFIFSKNQILGLLIFAMVSFAFISALIFKIYFLLLTLGFFLSSFSSDFRCAAAAKSLQLCPTLCDPIDGSPPGSPVPGILQARTLEWVAISFSRGSSRPRDRTWVSCIAGRFFII